MFRSRDRPVIIRELVSPDGAAVRESQIGKLGHRFS